MVFPCKSLWSPLEHNRYTEFCAVLFSAAGLIQSPCGLGWSSFVNAAQLVAGGHFCSSSERWDLCGRGQSIGLPGSSGSPSWPVQRLCGEFTHQCRSLPLLHAGLHAGAWNPTRFCVCKGPGFQMLLCRSGHPGGEPRSSALSTRNYSHPQPADSDPLGLCKSKELALQYSFPCLLQSYEE